MFSYDYSTLLLRIYLPAFGCCIIIAAACYSNMIGKVIFSNSVIRYLVKISYGLYCFHAIVLTGISKYLQYSQTNLSPVYIFFLTLFFTILLSIISYEYFEKRFIAQKQYFLNNAYKKKNNLFSVHYQTSKK